VCAQLEPVGQNRRTPLSHLCRANKPSATLLRQNFVASGLLFRSFRPPDKELTLSTAGPLH